jgi:hypothetical protein
LVYFVEFMFIWYIFSRFGTLYKEKSGNPDNEKYIGGETCSGGAVDLKQARNRTSSSLPLRIVLEKIGLQSCISRERCLVLSWVRINKPVVNLLSRKFRVINCARLPNYLKKLFIVYLLYFLTTFNCTCSQILHFHFENVISNV